MNIWIGGFQRDCFHFPLGTYLDLFFRATSCNASFFQCFPLSIFTNTYNLSVILMFLNLFCVSQAVYHDTFVLVYPPLLFGNQFVEKILFPETQLPQFPMITSLCLFPYSGAMMGFLYVGEATLARR